MSRPLPRRGAALLAAALAVALSPAPVAAAPAGPAVPTAVWASTVGSGIALTWQQPRTGARATSFRVYENDTVVARTTTTAVYPDVAFSSAHTYTVTAVDQQGRESARSPAVTGRSWQYGYNPECMPDPGVPLTVSDVSASAFSLAWTRHPLGGDLELRVDGRTLGPFGVTGARLGGLAPGTVHQVALYRDNRCASGGGSRLVASALVTTATGTADRPAAPAAPVVTGRTDTTIGLSWTAAPGTPPARYAVYDGATLVAVTTGTTATVDRLFPGTAHRFTIAARDAAGHESVHSAPVTAGTATCLGKPPRPVGLTTTAVSPSTVRLSWTLEAVALTYTVLDGETPVATTRHPGVVLSGLPPASTHAYRVFATLPSGCGDTAPSRRLRVTTAAGPAARPAAPASLALAANMPGPTMAEARVTLTWIPASGSDPATGYRLYEGTTVVGETTGTSLTLTVGSNTTHEYAVVAVDAAGHESAPGPRLTVRATYLSPP